MRPGSGLGARRCGAVRIRASALGDVIRILRDSVDAHQESASDQ